MFDNIPLDLKERAQWVCWSLEARGNKPTKIPINPKTGSLASVTSPSSWSTFDEAVESAMENGFSGIGFVFTESDPFVGIDVDGEIDPDLVEWFGSYAEKTQSGNGMHIILRGELDENRRSGKYEIYDRTRFFVMTGELLLDAKIESRQEKIKEFMDVFPSVNSAIREDVEQGEPAMADHDVLSEIRRSSQSAKFETLWSGNWSREQPSQSDADASLLSILRFWTGGHREQTIRIFGGSQLAERDKWLRTDYQDRSWNAINAGPVRDLTPRQHTRIPAFLRTKASVTPQEVERVRKVLDEEAREAISNTPLETMVRVLEKVTDPPLPLELTLPKAYAMAGGALCGKASNPVRAVHGGRGVDLASVVIDTAGGQACNVYALTIAESASGKDVGSLVSRVLSKKGWSIGGTGSAEGFMDVLADKPVAVMEIGEFQNWLDQRHWQSKAAPTVTDIFNKYWFQVHLSQRGEGNNARQSNYCALSITANIQPGVIHRFADRLALDSGFLNRFLLCKCRNNEFRYPQKIDPVNSVKIIEDALKHYEQVSGKVRINMREKFGHMVAEFEGAPFAPHWKRLINEYGPRLALMLSTQTGRAPTISDEGIDKACTLIRWHYYHALDVLKWFEKDDQKWEKFVLRVFKAIKRAGGTDGVSRSTIAHRIGGVAKQRQQALEELIERGFVDEVSRGKFKVIHEPDEWK